MAVLYQMMASVCVCNRLVDKYSDVSGSLLPQYSASQFVLVTWKTEALCCSEIFMNYMVQKPQKRQTFGSYSFICDGVLYNVSK